MFYLISIAGYKYLKKYIWLDEWLDQWWVVGSFLGIKNNL